MAFLSLLILAFLSASCYLSLSLSLPFSLSLAELKFNSIQLSSLPSVCKNADAVSKPPALVSRPFVCLFVRSKMKMKKTMTTKTMSNKTRQKQKHKQTVFKIQRKSLSLSLSFYLLEPTVVCCTTFLVYNCKTPTCLTVRYATRRLHLSNKHHILSNKCMR